MTGNRYEAVEKGYGKDEVMYYSCIEKRMMGKQL